MSSDLPRITIRLEPKNKLKLKYIANLEDRSISREARRIILQYITRFEEEHGEIKVDETV